MTARLRLACVDVHTLASRHVGDAFRIQVAMPVERLEARESFPVLYVTEANLTFEVARIIALTLQAASEVRRFIVVGIGYLEDTPFASGILRGRDLTPPNYPDIPGLPRASVMEGVRGLEAQTPRSNGGPAFLDFIRHELAPFVDANYPTAPGDRAYFGHSLGGRFGLHALFSGSRVFSRYIISSPGLTWHDNEHGLEEARGFLAGGAAADAQLFMSVAEGEEFEEHLGASRMVSSFYRLAAALRHAPGLDLRTRVLKDETHASVWPLALRHGVTELFGRPERPLLETPAWEKASGPERSS